jgi:hypothetical protein
MSVVIRIDEAIYDAAKKTARTEYRSIPNQIEYWAMIGKCALDNPDLPIEFIKDVLMAKNSDKLLAEPLELPKCDSRISVELFESFKCSSKFDGKKK